MVTEVILPKLSQTMEEGKILEWLKREGDRVSKGELLYVVETDKVNAEVEAPGSGVLRRIVKQVGDVVPISSVIAYIGEPNEPLPEPAGQIFPAAPVTRVAPPPQAAAPSAPPVAPRRAGKILATPVAKRLAEERGIDLATIAGTGPEGQITKEDVERAASAKPAGAPIAQAQGLTTMQRLIAERTLKSVREVPHFFVTVEVEMAKAQTHSKTHGASLTALLIKAAALALKEFPDVNVRFAGDRIERNPSINIGVIVAVPEGMLIPVVRDADTKPLAQIAREEHDLAERGRRGALKPEELTGGTFTISNLGMFGVDHFTAIIYPPESAILAVGRVADQVVAREGQVVIRPMMAMTLSSDHRVIYGAMAGQFMARLRQLLENPDFS